MTEPLHVVIFAAKSTADKKGSIPQQIEDCREFAQQQGWIVDGQPESDEAASAYTANRGAGLERAMTRAGSLAEKHGRAGLLIWHPNRLARGGGDAPDAARHLAEYLFWALRSNVELHSVHEGSTFSNPIMAALMGHMTHEESKAKGAAVKRGMRGRRAKRLHTGGAIYGYDRDPDRGLKKNPEQAATVVRIFEMVAAGKSQAEVARILNGQLQATGAPKPRRAHQWAQGHISGMLRRRTYLGEMQDEGEWVEAKHEAIVSADLFEAANRRREEAAAVRGRKGGPRPKAGHLLIGGMLRHVKCGSAMTPVSLDPKRDGSVTGAYECAGRKAGICEGLRVGMGDVDETITGYLAEVGIDVEESLRLLREASTSRHEATEAELAAARREAAKAEANWSRVRRDYMEGKLTAEDWAEFRTDLESEKVAAAARVERLKAKAEEANASPEVIVPAAADALALIRAAIDADDTDSVRAAIESLFSDFLVGDLDEMPEQHIPGSPAADTASVGRWRERIVEMEAAAGRTVAEANAEAMAEEAALDMPHPPPAEIVTAKRVTILPQPREDALASIVEDGQPVYLVDEEGRSAFRRIPFAVTYNDALQR